MARGPQDPLHSLAEGKILQVPFFLVLDFGSSVSNWTEMEEFMYMVYRWTSRTLELDKVGKNVQPAGFQLKKLETRR